MRIFVPIAILANDQTYSPEIRRTCIFELFHRHVRAGMSLGEVADRLNKPDWLPQGCIHAKKAWTGYMPVEHVPGDSIFEIAILPSGHGKGYYVCLRISGRVSEEELGAALRGGSVGASIQGSKLQQIGFVE
jgi:hypothetical protein